MKTNVLVNLLFRSVEIPRLSLLLVYFIERKEGADDFSLCFLSTVTWKLFLSFFLLQGTVTTFGLYILLCRSSKSRSQDLRIDRSRFHASECKILRSARASRKLVENIGKLFTVPWPFPDLFSAIWLTVQLNELSVSYKMYGHVKPWPIRTR